jgi:hypothetical protein
LEPGGQPAKILYRDILSCSTINCAKLLLAVAFNFLRTDIYSNILVTELYIELTDRYLSLCYILTHKFLSEVQCRPVSTIHEVLPIQDVKKLRNRITEGIGLDCHPRFFMLESKTYLFITKLVAPRAARLRSNFLALVDIPSGYTKIELPV